jgi:uncharacterized protein (TIGR02145 family)
MKMKKAIILSAMFCVAAFAQQKGAFTDTRDGKTYKTVKIGEQVWMAENLNYEAEGSRCYKDRISYCGKYGRLYNWATAKRACPSGWHLPRNEEWMNLYNTVGGSSVAESNLKAKSGWITDEGYKSGNGEDKYGFSALPGGLGNPGGSFSYVGHIGRWWVDDPPYDSDYAYYWYINYDPETGYDYDLDKNYLLSVRCVGD